MSTAAHLLNYLAQHQSFSDDEHRERLKTIEHDPNVIRINNNANQLVGLIEVKRYENYMHGSCAHLTIAYDLHNDVQRIAKAKFDEILKQLKHEHVRMVMIGVNINQTDTHQIVQEQAFKPWYGYVFMRHEGSIPQSNKLRKRIIKEDDYEHYIHVMSACFKDMRQAMNIQPYEVMEMLWRDEEHKQKNRAEWWRHRDQTWMYYADDQWVGSGLIYKEDIDDVFVPLALQGRSYGRMIVEDLIVEAYHRKIRPYIGYVKWNARAGHLYQSLGFKAYLEVQYYQKFL